MIVEYDKDKQKVPIKAWIPNRESIEDTCWEQAVNLANLPFAFKWVSLMPDCHAGFGMPIGGVLATEGFIIPNAVGNDISCGMAYVQTNIPAKIIKETKTPNGTLAQAIIGDMMRSIPVGFAKHKKFRTDEAYYKKPPMDENGNLLVVKLYDLTSLISQQLLKALPEFSLSFGTLGGGNHFIELQEGDDGLVGIMIHSGSRSLGGEVAKQYDRIAKNLNERYFSSVPSSWGLSFLPVDDEAGQEYIHWMNFAVVTKLSVR